MEKRKYIIADCLRSLVLTLMCYSLMVSGSCLDTGISYAPCPCDKTECCEGVVRTIIATIAAAQGRLEEFAGQLVMFERMLDADITMVINQNFAHIIRDIDDTTDILVVSAREITRLLIQLRKETQEQYAAFNQEIAEDICSFEEQAGILQRNFSEILSTFLAASGTICRLLPIVQQKIILATQKSANEAEAAIVSCFANTREKMRVFSKESAILVKEFCCALLTIENKFLNFLGTGSNNLKKHITLATVHLEDGICRSEIAVVGAIKEQQRTLLRQINSLSNGLYIAMSGVKKNLNNQFNKVSTSAAKGASAVCTSKDELYKEIEVGQELLVINFDCSWDKLALLLKECCQKLEAKIKEMESSLAFTMRCGVARVEDAAVSYYGTNKDAIRRLSLSVRGLTKTTFSDLSLLLAELSQKLVEALSCVSVESDKLAVILEEQIAQMEGKIVHDVSVEVSNAIGKVHGAGNSISFTAEQLQSAVLGIVGQTMSDFETQFYLQGNEIRSAISALEVSIPSNINQKINTLLISLAAQECPQGDPCSIGAELARDIVVLISGLVASISASGSCICTTAAQVEQDTLAELNSSFDMLESFMDDLALGYETVIDDTITTIHSQAEEICTRIEALELSLIDAIDLEFTSLQDDIAGLHTLISAIKLEVTVINALLGTLL